MSRNRKMKAFIGCILLVVLFGIIVLLSFAQQEQTTQKPDPEIKALRKRILVLQSQRQTVENENVELIVKLLDAQAKLADANAKLMSTEFGAFERNLRDSNNKWLWGWTAFFVGIFAVIGIALWFFVKSLIADRVERSLNGFKEAIVQVDTLKNELTEAVGQVNILQDQIRILEKEHAVSMLNNFMGHRFDDEASYPEQINRLPERALVDVFGDETYYLGLRCWAAEILANRESTRLVFPMLEFLNSAVNSDLYNETSVQTESILRSLVSFLSEIHTQETCEGLKKFLNRLLTENPRHKDLFLTWTAFSLAYVSIQLNRKDSASILRKSIPDLNVLSQDESALKNLIEYFDRFNEPEGIKEILIHHAAEKLLDVEGKCLELLQKHNSDFVKEWKAQKATTNTGNNESL